MENAEKAAVAKKQQVVITPPNIQVAKFRIVGTAPLVINKFSTRVIADIIAKQQQGDSAKNKKKREPKDFDQRCKEATHFSEDGWEGLPASAFRNGLISACRVAGFPMTKGKLSIFVLPDGYERERTGDTPLVKITKGKPQRSDIPVRLATGVMDISPRPQWKEGWEAVVTIEWDADQFTITDVTNLLSRMGKQVGIGAGRPDSSSSTGCGWGTFKIAEAKA